MSIQEIGIIIALVITTVGAIFSVYDRFTNPDRKNEKDISNSEGEIALIKQGCLYKHTAINEAFTAIKDDLHLLRVNHVDHIENDIKGINEKQTKILTILEAKYQIKIK